MLTRHFLIVDTSLSLAVIEQVQPHLTLVSNRADPALIDAIKATRTYTHMRRQDDRRVLPISQSLSNPLPPQITSTSTSTSSPSFPLSAITSLALLPLVGRSTAEYVPTVEIRPAREFVSGQGRSSLLTLPLFSGELQTDEDVGLDGRAPQHGDDADDEIVHVGQEQLTAAQQFMRLRYKRIRTPASAFVSALRLGSSLAQGTDKTVSCSSLSAGDAGAVLTQSDLPPFCPTCPARNRRMPLQLRQA